MSSDVSPVDGNHWRRGRLGGVPPEGSDNGLGNLPYEALLSTEGPASLIQGLVAVALHQVHPPDWLGRKGFRGGGLGPRSWIQAPLPHGVRDQTAVGLALLGCDAGGWLDQVILLLPQMAVEVLPT